MNVLQIEFYQYESCLIMPTEKIGQYKLEECPTGLVVHEYPNKKAIWDILLFLGKGIFFLLFLITIFNSPLNSPNGVYFVLMIIFLSPCIYYFFQAAIRTVSLIRPKLVINAKLKILKINYLFFLFKKIDFKDIVIVQLKGHIDEVVTLSSLPVRRIYCCIKVITIAGNTKEILVVNTSKLWKSTDREIKQQVYFVGRKIGMRIAKEINSKYQWVGFESGNS